MFRKGDIVQTNSQGRLTYHNDPERRDKIPYAEVVEVSNGYVRVFCAWSAGAARRRGQPGEYLTLYDNCVELRPGSHDPAQRAVTPHEVTVTNEEVQAAIQSILRGGEA